MPQAARVAILGSPMTSRFAAGRDVDKNLADLVHLGSQTPVYLVEVAGELSGTLRSRAIATQKPC